MPSDFELAFEKTPVVAILRRYDTDTVLWIAEAYQEAGFTCLEITMNTDGAPEIISSLRSKFPDLKIGAGTVCDRKDLEKAIEAGAQFIVTPILDEQVIKHCVTLALPIFPGAYTPTEIYKAWAWGATAVKVFPASQLGVAYIKDVLAPLNHLKLLPTGGVSKENIAAYFKAGAKGVGMGSSLLPKELIDKRDKEGIILHLQELKSLIP